MIRIILAGLILSVAISAQGKAEPCVELDSLNKTKVDSLKHELETKKIDTDKIEILKNLNMLTRDYDPIQALEFANKYHEIVYPKHNPIYDIKDGRMRAYSLMDLGKNNEAVKILSSCLEIIKENESVPEVKDNERAILNNLGVSYTFLGLYERSLETHLKALELKLKTGNAASISASLNNIGLVYYNMTNYKKALEYFNQSLEKVPYEDKAYHIYNNIGLVYSALRKYDEALLYFDKGIEVCGSDCIDRGIIEGTEGKGIVYLWHKEFRRAEECLRKVILLSRKVNNAQYYLEGVTVLGQLYFDEGRYAESLEVMLPIEKQIPRSKIAQVTIAYYKYMARIYKELSNKNRAEYFKVKYHQKYDSVFQDGMGRNLKTLEDIFKEKSKKSNLSVIPNSPDNRNIDSFRFQWIFIVITLIICGLAVFISIENRKLATGLKILSSSSGNIIFDSTLPDVSSYEKIKQFCTSLMAASQEMKDVKKMIEINAMITVLNEKV